jgi:osmotically-inducible protein OsmY
MGNRLWVLPVATLGLVVPQACDKAGIDARIEQAARESYTFKSHLQGDTIQVAARDGHVILDGHVKNELHRNLAEETVAGLPGVRSVDNRLAVDSPSGSQSADVWLGTTVMAALRYHQNVDAEATNVEVKDGVVTLSGVAGSSAQKELTADIVRGLEGVGEVHNQIQVRPTAGQNLAAKLDDASVTAMVKAVLLGHRGTRVLATKVKTDGGVVTLEGKARNGAERDLVERLASGVRGVQKVHNRMNVES